jgi:hypothetical protein
MAGRRKTQSNRKPATTGPSEPRAEAKSTEVRELDEHLDPEVRSAADFAADEAFWRTQYRHRPYYQPDTEYSDYEPAYRCGYTSAARHGHKKFDEIVSELEHEWEKIKGKSSLAWEHAREAIRDAWDKVMEKLRGKNATGP